MLPFVGALTKNIVAMKERLEGDLPKADQQSRTDHSTLTEAQRQKEREIVTKEVCMHVDVAHNILYHCM